jgi:hypothetical protein
MELLLQAGLAAMSGWSLLMLYGGRARALRVVRPRPAALGKCS